MALQLKARAQTALHDLWQIDTDSQPPVTRMVLLLVRMAHLLFSELFNGSITMRAGNLAFITLLSLIPLLAVVISVLKAFGFQYELQPMLVELMLPLGEQGMELALDIIFFVERINVDLLGIAGVIVFFYTAVSLISNVEKMMNYMWHVEASRNLLKRVFYYLTVIIFAPVLVVAAVGMSATMSNSGFVTELATMEPFGTLFYLLGLFLPFFMAVIAFATVYLALPNTKVRISPALQAALLSAILWKLAGWLFTSFVVSSGRYHAIYSGMASVVLFMVWVQLSWIIFLIGAKFSYLIQNPSLMKRAKPDHH